MEPHAATAYWDDGGLIVHDSNQGSVRIQSVLAALFGLDAAGVQVIAEYVGGGFGSRPASGHPRHSPPSHRKWPGGPLRWSSPGGKCSRSWGAALRRGSTYGSEPMSPGASARSSISVTSRRRRYSNSLKKPLCWPGSCTRHPTCAPATG
jgi:Molybdopterin-binding domain of aldehyde dehydrogenase